MTLRILRLPSLAEDLDEVVPPRDCSPMPVHVPTREVIERQLHPAPPASWPRGRRK